MLSITLKNKVTTHKFLEFLSAKNDLQTNWVQLSFNKLRPWTNLTT